MSELTPYICVADSRAAIEWYREHLGAEVTVEPIVMDDGRVGHCELAVDGARWMMSDAFDEAGVAPPDPGRGNAVTLHLTVADVDERVPPGAGGRRDARPRARGQPADRPARGLPRPLRPPLVPQPAAAADGRPERDCRAEGGQRRSASRPRSTRKPPTPSSTTVPTMVSRTATKGNAVASLGGEPAVDVHGRAGRRGRPVEPDRRVEREGARSPGGRRRR